MGCKHNWQISHSNNKYPYRCTKCGKRSEGIRKHSGKKSYLKATVIIVPVSVITILLLILPSQSFESLANFVSKSLASIPAATNSASNLMPSNILKVIPNKILTEDNYYAQLEPSNVQVTDKGRYNVVSFTVTVNVQNLPFDGSVYFEDLYTTLVDENSKVYQPDTAECSMSDLIPIIGKETTSTNYNVCYSVVDKSASKFSILYNEPLANYHMTRVGHLSVDSNLFSYYESHRSSQPIQIGMIDLAK